MVVAVFESPLSDFSGGFGFVTITTINFFSSMLYSDRAFSSVSILPERNTQLNVNASDKQMKRFLKVTVLKLFFFVTYQHKLTFGFPPDNLYPFPLLFSV